MEVDNRTKELCKAIDEYRRWRDWSDRAYERMDRDPENVRVECRFAEFYRKELEALCTAKKLAMETLNISEDAAKRLVITKADAIHKMYTTIQMG